MARRVRRVYVPMLTDRYGVHVYLGPRDALDPIASRHAERPMRVQLGLAINRLEPDAKGDVRNPSIFVDNTEATAQVLATLAHEACHAADYVMEYLRIDDHNGEVRAHLVGTVVRLALEKTGGKLR